MTMPQYISREELLERLLEELAAVVEPDSTWWATNSVPPFPAQYGDVCHFVVAVAGDQVIFFADDEDEFGIARLGEGNLITDYGLVGDLRDAVSIIRKMRPNTAADASLPGELGKRRNRPGI
jgi:hypothetical protein